MSEQPDGKPKPEYLDSYPPAWLTFLCLVVEVFLVWLLIK